MPPRLIALDSNHVILLDKPVVLLGRHPECDVQLESRKISRKHCCIAEVDQSLSIRDLGSTNGIRINGEPLEEGRLHNGDELVIGNLRYQVRWEEEPPEASPRKQSGRPAAAPQAVSLDHLPSLDIPVAIKEPHQHSAMRPPADGAEGPGNPPAG